MKFKMLLLSKNHGTHSSWSSRWQVSEPSHLECLVPFVTVAMAICSPLSASQPSPLYFCLFFTFFYLFFSHSFLPTSAFLCLRLPGEASESNSGWADTSEASTQALNPILWRQPGPFLWTLLKKTQKHSPLKKVKVN